MKNQYSRKSQFLSESPIENRFEQRFLEFCLKSLKIERQYIIRTICGIFRVDFFAYDEKNKIAIECDGRKFHDYEFDFWRDALIIGTGDVDDIVRISGHQINFNAYCLSSENVMLEVFTQA